MDVNGLREVLSNLAGCRVREYVSLHGRIAGGLGEFVMPGHRLMIERHRREDWLARAKAIVEFVTDITHLTTGWESIPPLLEPSDDHRRTAGDVEVHL